MTRIRTWLAELSLADRIVVVFAAMVIVLVTISSTNANDVETPRSFDAAAFGLLLGALLCLLARKRFPGTVAVAVIGLAMVWYGVGYTSGLINVPIMVSCYLLGTTGDRRRQLGIGGLVVGFPLMSIVAFSDEPLSEVIEATGWPVAGILFGEIMRNRRLLVEELAERAHSAEAERDAEAERRVAEERLRIARDVHDVLAHTVSVMTVQAGAAADTLDRDPDATRRSLATIRSAGKEAMAEVKATISVLRRGEPADSVEVSPAPRLDRLADLVDVARARGLEVDLSISLDRDQALESLVELTAYRIVQESLTNVTRHADASHAEVHIDQRPSELVVEIRDNGPAAGANDAPGPGFGLKGMRERVEPLGGTLSFGPRPDGGWEVAATFPLRKARS